MYVNTSGGGKTQQQQSLQNQTNASVRHNNPFPHSLSQQQPHYEHHQGPVTFVYPFCNVAAATHSNTGGNNVGVSSGQAGHMLFQTQHQHQTQSQQHPTQPQVGLHNTEQTLHYFTKSTPLPQHHLHHAPQQHPPIRNMIAAVSHQRQPFMALSPNYFALSHALLPQQTRASILTNAGPQHAVAAASGGSIATQLQNSAPRSVPPNGPTAYVTPPYCTPPLLLGATSTPVTPQPSSMLTAATGIVQPPSLQAYAHMSSGLPAATTQSTSINVQNIGVGLGTTSNTEHRINTKQRPHAIPIINPVTQEIVTYEQLVDAQPKPQIQTQTKSDFNVESVSIQTDNDKSLTVSVKSDLSDVVLPTCSHSSSTAETDKISVQMQTEEYDYEIAKQTSAHEMERTTLISVPDLNTETQSLQSGSESVKNYVYEDPNDTDADTNEHELDNEDVMDPTAGNLPTSNIHQELPTNPPEEEQIEEVPKTDLLILQPVESDTDYTAETEVKSKDEPCTTSLQISLDINDEEKFSETQEDLQPSMSSFVVCESKKNKRNRKNAKNKEKNQKNSKQQNKSNNISIQKNANSSAIANFKTAAAVSDKKASKPKNLPKKDDTKPNFIRYSLEELRALGNSPESRKTPVVRCQKGDCVSLLFVPRQQHHHMSHQNQHVTTMNLQHHAQQSYHQMNYNESLDYVNGKRRSVGGGGATARKYQEHHVNLPPTGYNNNSELQSASGTMGVGSNTAQIQKKMQVIRINLSLNEEIKLSECKNAWQPKFVANNTNNNLDSKELGRSSSNDDIEDVLKKVRGILNKLTSENFDVLLKEMTNITINTSEKMQKIMLLIFEKTVSEPNFAPIYAKFCKILFEEIKAESREAFNKLLIDRLKKEFDLNVNNADAKERKLQEIINKLNDATDPQEKMELQAEFEHEDYQFRRRAWGTVRFIGELCKLRALSSSRVLVCVESLLEHGNEEKLEYMCKLLTTVGNLLENGDAKSFNNVRMNKIFEKMQTIIKEAKDPGKKNIKICSRVRFMMQDLIDLRSKKWGQQSYAQNSHDAQRRRLPEDKNSNLPSGSVNSYERGSSQRMSYGNNRQHQSRTKDTGSAGGNSGNYFMQKSSKSQFLGQLDVKKLNFTPQETTKLGSSNTYTSMWRVAGRQTNQTIDSQQHQPPPQQQQQQQQTQYWNAKNPNSNSSANEVFKPCSRKDNEKLLNHLMEEYLDCLRSRSNRWQEEIISTWQKTNIKQQICLVYYILMEYLHSFNVHHLERNSCANIFIFLKNNNVFNETTFNRAYEMFAEEFPDLLTDVPNGWTYVFQFIGPLLHERFITFKDIWKPNWRTEQKFTERFVEALVVYFTKEFGANYMRDLWQKEFNPDQWHQFTDNKLQFLYDSKVKPDITLTNANSSSQTTMDQHIQRLELLLNSPNDSNLALDYINTNVNINSCFLKRLTRYLCCDYAISTKTTLSGTSRTSSTTTSKNSSTCSNTSSSSSTKNEYFSSRIHLNVDVFRKNCLPLLRLCLDAHEDHELVCLNSVVNGLQEEYDPKITYELICGIFDNMYDCEVIAKESFEKWYKQRLKDQKQSKIKIRPELCSKLNDYMQKLL